MGYSDISRGVRLAADHAKYMLWLNKDTAARQAAYAAVTTPANKVKTDRVPGYLVPFTSTGALVYLPARLIADTQTGRGGTLASTLRGILGEYTFTQAEVGALTNPNILEGVKKFKPAKLTIIQRVSTATTKEASRITGRLYYRHENDSVTGVFGKKLVGDTQDTVIAAIKEKAEFKALFTGSANALASKFRFVPEAL